MPSSVRYKANRKSHYGQEEKTRKKREGTPSDPNASKPRIDRAKLRKKLGLKKGNPTHAGHTALKGKTLAKTLKKGGKTTGKKQNAKANMSAGGKVGNRKGKASGAAKGRRTMKKGG